MDKSVVQNQLRPLVCELGQLKKPDGSASLSSGGTSALAAVYGPGEVKVVRELFNRCSVEVVYKPKLGMPGCAEKLKERTVRNIFETAILTSLHPRSAIRLTVQEVQNSGSLLACCINACCLAVMDASISMKFLVAAVSCALDDEGAVVLDPSGKEEKEAAVLFTFVFDNVEKHIVAVKTSGCYSDEQFQTALRACKRASEKVFSFYRELMQKKMSHG